MWWMEEVPSEKNMLHRNYNPWMLIMRSVYALGIKIQIWFSNAYKFIQKFPLHLTQGHRYIKTPQKCSQHWDSFQKCSKGLRLALQHNFVQICSTEQITAFSSDFNLC